MDAPPVQAVPDAASLRVRARALLRRRHVYSSALGGESQEHVTGAASQPRDAVVDLARLQAQVDERVRDQHNRRHGACGLLGRATRAAGGRSTQCGWRFRKAHYRFAHESLKAVKICGCALGMWILKETGTETATPT